MAPSLRHFGVSLGHRSEQEAEYWLRALRLPGGVDACTHRVSQPYPHVAVSLATEAGTRLDLPPIPTDLWAAAAEASSAHASGLSGRAVHFRGAATLTGVLTVASILALTAIDRITVLDGDPAEPNDLLHVDDPIRPEWMHGALTLMARPTTPGRLAPALAGSSLARSTPRSTVGSRAAPER